jgi:peptidoglycan L-alanyl-D-glutamate endopeptidase CwlK
VSTQTQRTQDNLVGVHPDLVTLWNAAVLPYPCQVIDGLRTFDEQEQMVKTGASQTLNSRHLTGHAIDFAVWPNGLDNDVSWNPSYYIACVRSLKSTAKGLGIHCTFGADWEKLKDYTHVQLSWEHYPISQAKPPKTAANSKTIATASVGVPVVTFFQDIFNGLKAITGSLLEGVDANTIGIIQTIALVAIVLFLVRERYKNINTEGV